MSSHRKNRCWVGGIPTGEAVLESDGVDFEPVYVWTDTPKGAILVSKFAIEATQNTPDFEQPGEVTQIS